MFVFVVKTGGVEYHGYSESPAVPRCMKTGVSEQTGLNEFKPRVIGVNLRRKVALNRADKTVVQVSVKLYYLYL
jgi:hypothetical protein